jgi:Ca2+-binding EF-hand superfamily protein
MSDFWIRKMRTYFQRFDLDGDGVLSLTEFLQGPRRFAQFGRLNDEQSEELSRKLTILFEQFADGNIDEPLTQDKFVESLKKRVWDPDFKKNYLEPGTMSFRAVDANDDGSISFDELALFFEILGFKDDAKLAREAFDAVDTDKDGIITLEEWQDAKVDFFTNVDDESSNGRLVWGPLV